jgi:hypothetical protein
MHYTSQKIHTLSIPTLSYPLSYLILQTHAVLPELPTLATVDLISKLQAIKYRVHTTKRDIKTTGSYIAQKIIKHRLESRLD